MNRYARQIAGRFLWDEKGAVTVDWVVLTAAITGLVFILVGILNEALVAGTTEQGIASRIDDARNVVQATPPN